MPSAGFEQPGSDRPSGSFGFAAAPDLGFVRVCGRSGSFGFPTRRRRDPRRGSIRDWEFYPISVAVTTAI
jgi:hypothetical protein